MEISQENIEAAIWYQKDSAYLHRCVLLYMEKPPGAWNTEMATRLQENAANSARLAREAMGFE